MGDNVDYLKFHEVFHDFFNLTAQQEKIGTDNSWPTGRRQNGAAVWSLLGHLTTGRQILLSVATSFIASFDSKDIR